MLSLSLLQVVDPSGKGSATWILLLHSARFSASSTLSCKSSMLYLTTSIHLFLCLPLLRCPHTFASKIHLTQSSSSHHCTCPYHLSLASRTLSVIHATPRMRRMSSFLFLSLKVRPRIHRNILTLVLYKRSSSRLLNVHASEPVGLFGHTTLLITLSIFSMLQQFWLRCPPHFHRGHELLSPGIWNSPLVSEPSLFYLWIYVICCCTLKTYN